MLTVWDKTAQAADKDQQKRAGIALSHTANIRPMALLVEATSTYRQMASATGRLVILKALTAQIPSMTRISQAQAKPCHPTKGAGLMLALHLVTLHRQDSIRERLLP